MSRNRGRETTKLGEVCKVAKLPYGGSGFDLSEREIESHLWFCRRKSRHLSAWWDERKKWPVPRRSTAICLSLCSCFPNRSLQYSGLIVQCAFVTICGSTLHSFWLLNLHECIRMTQRELLATTQFRRDGNHVSLSVPRFSHVDSDRGILYRCNRNKNVGANICIVLNSWINFGYCIACHVQLPTNDRLTFGDKSCEYGY